MAGKSACSLSCPGARHELNDLGAHEQLSQIAMAINPTSASDIR
jgi:hypothetical protein